MLSLGSSQFRGLICALCVAVVSIACVVGCPGGNRTPNNLPALPTPTIRILVIDDQSLADAIEQEWTASGRGDLVVQVASLESLTDAKRLAADCIIYPCGLLGELAQRQLIVPLPSESLSSQELNRSDFFPLTRMRETTWGHDVYAVPLGSPSFALLYRRDILDKLGRDPPTTWEQYQELIELLENSADSAPPAASETDWQPAVEPLAGDSAGEILLARAAPYARHPGSVSVLFDYKTMEPLIDQPPFVRALRELVDANRGKPHALEATRDDARSLLLSGKCGMALCWPTSSATEAEDGVEINCAPLPGANTIFNNRTKKWETTTETSHAALLGISGRMGSITSSARHTGAAAAALTWLASADITPTIAISNEACSLCRSTQVSQGSEWVARAYGDAGQQYASVLQADKSRPLWCFSVRIPGRSRYLETLSAAVRSAVKGEKTPELALKDAADQWRDITAELGVEAQRDAYARSLGIED